MISASDFLTVAKEQIGVTEGKDGSTKYGKWYADRVRDPAFRTAAWCDMALSWISYEAGRRAGGVKGAEEALSQTGCFAYTPWHAQWFARQSRFGNKAYQGAFVFFDWAASKSLADIDHIGVVAGITDDGLLITYEGNVSNGFKKLYRSFRNIVGFGYPKWAEKAALTTAKTVSVKKPTTTKAPKFPLPEGHVYGIASLNKKIHPGTTPVDQKNIKLFQSRLKERGWRITPDGIFGPQTKGVVLDFQAEKRLEVDGLVGPITWDAFWTAPIT
jgi:Putative peptidoglycan-binding domain-containing protein